MSEAKPIGILPATANFPEKEVIPDVPFKVNKASPHQQALARTKGWDHLRRLERIDAQPADHQRSPFSRSTNPLPEVKPKVTI